MERPVNFSWILPGRLAVGETPDSFVWLRSLGFRAVLNLQEEEESQPVDELPPGVRFERVPIRDGIVGGVPAVEDIARAVAILRGFQESGLCTYVHCFAGVGRSPTICMAYLARSEGLGFVEAFRRVAEVHAPTSPTAGQLAALAEYLTSTRAGGAAGQEP